MSLRILSVAPPLASLLLFSTFVVAQIDVTATCTLPSYSWTFNSLGQSPCLVIGYMQATCFGGSVTLGPLPPGWGYSGPAVGHSNLCQCSTIGFSLISACAACQDGNPFDWSIYVANCTSTLPPSQFPNPVPAGIYVPHWAILDVTNENFWNAQESYAAGDNPEYGPGAIFGASGVYTGTPPASSSSTGMSSASASSTGTSSVGTGSSTPTPPPTSSSSNAGAIAGGVVGGIAAISIAVAAVFLYLRRRPRTPPAEFDGAGAFQPHMDDAPRPLSDGGTFAPSSSSSSGSPVTMRFYDPDDPTTFPGHPGQQSLVMPPQVSTSSQIGSGSSLAMTPTSSQGPKGYHGLPMPSV